MKKLFYTLNFLILILIFSCGQNSAEKKLNGTWSEIDNEKIFWKFYSDSLVFIDDDNASVEWNATKSKIEFNYETFIWNSLGKPVDTEFKVLIEYELSKSQDTLLGTLTNLSGKHDFGLIRIKEGKIFTDVTTPIKGKAHLPRLFGSDDTLYMSWVEQEDSLAILKYASYKNDIWSIPIEVSSGTDWFVNWADFPSLAVNGENVLTNILQKSAEGTYDYDIKLHLLSSSSSSSSSSPFLLNTDGIPAEHGFVSSVPYKNGFSVSWLDGRNTKNEDPKDNQMTLRNTFVGLDGTITEETEIDARVCDCCNTATAITENGPVVVYRDRSDNKPEVRDMAITRKVNGKWTAPVAIGNDNWLLNGCPVNGPAIDSDKSNLVVSWFTAEGDTPRVMTTFSKDNGATFSTPIRVDGGSAIGRVGAQLIDNETALVSWLEPQGENTLLQVATIHSTKGVLNVKTVANTSSERQSGFPQLVVVDDKVYVAWTVVEGEDSTIKMVRFEVNL